MIVPLGRKQYLMARIVLIQPAYAHYRQQLFDQLHAGHDTTFVFLRGQRTYPSHLSPRPEWKCITLNGEKMRRWPLRLVRLLLRHPADVIITSIDGSWQTFVSLLVGRLRRIPVVLWSLSWGTPHPLVLLPWWKKWYHEMRARWSMTRADAVLVAGSRCREYHRRRGVAEDRMFFSPQSTIDHRSLAGGDEGQRAARRAGRIVNVLYFSRLVRYKGLDVLLRACAGLATPGSEVHLLIAGEGPFRRHCEQLRDELHLTNVYFLGSVPNEEAWKCYRQADIFVLPCSGKGMGEAWGLVINEALSMSLPVIVTEAVGCVPDLVQHGRNGYVVAPGSVDALRDALRKLVEDPSCRERMGRESRSIFEAFNSYEKAYRGFDAAIRFVLQQRESARGAGRTVRGAVPKANRMPARIVSAGGRVKR
jgi:glycosyltransferase involved in cell wall biosynthesis